MSFSNKAMLETDAPFTNEADVKRHALNALPDGEEVAARNTKAGEHHAVAYMAKRVDDG